MSHRQSDDTRALSTSPLHHGEVLPIDTATAEEAIKEGPRGALFVAGIAVTLLFLAWLAFYFLLFIPRGAVD